MLSYDLSLPLYASSMLLIFTVTLLPDFTGTLTLLAHHLLLANLLSDSQSSSTRCLSYFHCSLISLSSYLPMLLVCTTPLQTPSCSPGLLVVLSSCTSVFLYLAVHSFNLILLVICLLLIGVFSLLERVLLASIQYRQGPMTAMLHGFSQVVADGLKIYSKYSLDVLA